MPICSRCRKNKEDSEFKPNRKQCIACSEQKKEYYETHKEQKKEYYETHKEQAKEYRETHKEQIKEYRETHKEQTRENSLFYDAKKRAKDKNLEFNITKEDIKELLQTTTCCPIRKIPFEMGNGCVCDNSASLDKIDPKLGYIKGNIQLLSYKANTIKNNLTLQEYKEFVNNWKQYEELKSNKQIII